MPSITHHLIWLCFLWNLHFVSTTSNSTCPIDLNSACTALPFNTSNPPDVFLNVPRLYVEEISLLVENITARVSLTANVASLVSLNIGVGVSIDKVNLTIQGVSAKVQLTVYLTNVATMVTRTMQSLDLNPTLTSLVTDVFSTVNNLLATLHIDGQLVHLVFDSVGNIIKQVVDTAGNVISATNDGNYQKNMTQTGITQTLANNNTIVQYSYSPPAGSSQTANILVNVELSPNGTVLQTKVVNS